MLLGKLRRAAASVPLHRRSGRTSHLRVVTRSEAARGFASRTAAASTEFASDRDRVGPSWWAAAGVAISAMVAGSQPCEDSSPKARCAGIVGVVSAADADASSSSVDTRQFLLQGLQALGTRGIDGAGVVTVDPKTHSIQRSQKIVAPGGEPVDETLERLVGTHFQHRFNSLAASGPGSLPMALTAIGHTRWATHGSNADTANVHPHLDASGKVALVHNGSLINANEIRDELSGLGYTFEGQTDSEVLAKLIGHYYYGGVVATSKNAPKSQCSLREATRRALSRVEGTWGLCAVTSDAPNELVVACHGSPLFVGVSPEGSSQSFVSSDKSILANYAPTCIRLDEGEIGVLVGGSGGSSMLDLSGKEESEPAYTKEEDLVVSPAPHPHWALKEILDQPSAIGRSLCFGARLGWDRVHLGGLDSNTKELEKVEHLLLAGCGSSLNAARYGERLFKSIKAIPGRVVTLDAVEADDDDLYCASPSMSSMVYSSYPEEKKEDTDAPDPASIALLAISQSGETSDVMRLVEMAMTDIGLPVVGVTNTVGSSISRATKMGVYCHAGRENAVTSTKSFTAQVTILALIGLWFRQLRDKMELKDDADGFVPPNIETERLKESLLRLPISFGMALKTHEKVKEIAKRLSGKEHCFVLGKGFAEPVAYEGALKIKEMCYLHAEGYSGGALKHGPFALIEDETGKFGATPIIMFILDDHHAQHMRTAAEEVKARGAELIIITDKPSLARDLDDDPIVIPTNGPLTALSAIVPLQLLAYELALLRGHNPDTPRNLAKIL